MVADGLPIFCAGDVFHKWNSQPELINWAITHVPKMYAIPGQHDLPYHRYEDVHRSAFWTLVAADVIMPLPPGTPFAVNGPNGTILAWGFPWGTKVTAPNKGSYGLHLAVIHAYCWIEGRCFPGVTEESHLRSWNDKLKGFSAALFGDNHRGFLHWDSEWMNLPIYNHGTFIRRRSDERDLNPTVGFLHTDGTILPHSLDTSGDIWSDLPDEPEAHAANVDVERFVEFLRDVREVHVSFKDAVQEYMRLERIPQPVQDFLMMLIEKRQEIK